MGVIYHRRDPVNHIRDLLRFLRVGGELVLESLVIDEKYGAVLKPRGTLRQDEEHLVDPFPEHPERLAVRGAPHLCRSSGYIRLQRPAEQRATAWTFKQSLADFLDPQNPHLTIEGYPAPQRAIVICSR